MFAKEKFAKEKRQQRGDEAHSPSPRSPHLSSSLLALSDWTQVLGPCWVAGVDEVGRGALFGPVVAAAVLLSPTALSPLQTAGVTDSKQLSPRRRQQLASTIQATALDCQIGVASVAEIDRLNILQAALLAMQRAIQKLSPTPHFCLVDGNQPIPNLSLPQQTIVKGDQHILAIACASIIAKVWRDDLITRLARRYPGYDLVANKGYGSQRHRTALQTLGCTPLHRRSFRPCQVAASGYPL